MEIVPKRSENGDLRDPTPEKYFFCVTNERGIDEKERKHSTSGSRKDIIGVS